MENEKTSITTSSINLPVETVSTIIDVDNPNVEITIEDAIEKLKKDATDISSQNTQITITNVSELQNPRSINLDNVILNHLPIQILKIERKRIERTNEIKFFKATVDFSNGNQKTFIVPSFVKFYSSRRGAFIPIEFIRNRDILLDYTGNIVKIADAEPVDFEMTDFYNINVAYNTIEINEKEDAENNIKHLNENYNFYLNGILANISYNNFQKKDAKDWKKYKGIY